MGNLEEHNYTIAVLHKTDYFGVELMMISNLPWNISVSGATVLVKLVK